MSPLALPAEQGIWQNNYDATPSLADPGIQVVASGTAHTKGSYVSLVDPVTFDSHMLMLRIADIATTATNTDMLLDIAIGDTGGGNEQIILPDLLVGWTQAGNNRAGALQLYFPVFIPKGKSVRARCQSSVVSDTADVLAVLYEGAALPWRAFAGCDAYGVNSSGDSSGTSHTPGNTGAESSYASIGGTTSKNYRAIMLRVHPTNTTTSNLAYHWELGISSATPPGAEWFLLDTTSEEAELFPNFPYMINIPSGTQLQIRGECSGTAQAHDVAFYCFY